MAFQVRKSMMAHYLLSIISRSYYYYYLLKWPGCCIGARQRNVHRQNQAAMNMHRWAPSQQYTTNIKPHFCI